MRKMKDLTGQIFGRLLVVGFNSRDGKRYYWDCTCDCGKPKKVEGSSLKAGHTQSCGCLRKECDEDLKLKNTINMAGQVFGRLLVINNISERNRGGSVQWRCLCDCGNFTTVPRNDLVNSHTESCGCKKQEIMNNYLHFQGTNPSLLKSKRIWSTNTSGVRGVRWKSNRWESYITFKDKDYYLGRYENLSDAAAIRKQAEEKIFGEFLEWYDSQFPKKLKESEVNNEILLRAGH